MYKLIELIVIPSIIGGIIGTIGALKEIKNKERKKKNENANTK